MVYDSWVFVYNEVNNWLVKWSDFGEWNKGIKWLIITYEKANSV